MAEETGGADWRRSDAEAFDAADREWLAAVRGASSLAELAEVVGVASGHEAYLTAKPVWERRRGRELAALGRESCDDAPAADAPGSCTRVGDRRFHVHGITHADTDAEREFLRECVAAWLADGTSVYCEQGIRPLYLADTDACAMDDYRWAMDRCRDAEVESHVADLLDDESNDATSGTSETEEADTTDATTATDAASAIGETNATGADPEPTGTGTERPDWTDHADGPDAGHTEPFVTPSPDELSARFRDVALSLLESDVEDGAGGALRRSLRDVVSAFPPSHEDMATGRDTEAVRLRRAAAQDPAQLSRLQRYYERAFLPQALEREWLARHDPELEIVTHARNARMADYAVAHADTPEVHLLVGAAHGPGVREYLERHRDGRRSLDGFTPM